MNISMEESDKIFADSNYFIALSHPDDAHYEKAVLAAVDLEREKVILVVSNYIFLEVVTVLAQKRGKNVSVEAGKYMLNDPRIEHIHIDDALQSDTWSIFQNVQKKNMSFVDCSILAVIKSEGIKHLLTFDEKDFQPLQKRFSFSLYG